MAAHQAPISLGFSRQEHWSRKTSTGNKGINFCHFCHCLSETIKDFFHFVKSISWASILKFYSIKIWCIWKLSVQFSSIAQSCLIICNLLDCSMPGFPVHHQLPELTQTHVHWVSNAIQPSHALSSPSIALSISQYQGLFQWVSSSYQVATALEVQLQHQSFQWIFRVDFL